MTFLSRTLSLAGLFVVTLIAGFGWRDVAKGEAPRIEDLQTVLAGKPAGTKELQPTETFVQALANVDALHYGSENRQELTHSAVAGMLSALKDPHTILLEPEAAKQFQEKNHGQFVGIGAELTRDPLGAKVRRVFKNSPASRVGLKPNDIITKVHNSAVAGRDLLDVVDEIRGPSGTSVQLTVYRQDAEQPLTFEVERRQVQIQDVYGEVLSGPNSQGKPLIGKLEIRSFSETILAQFDEELADLESQGIRGLVIDVRGNPGGLLSAAVEMAARFLDNKVITSMKKRDGRPETFFSRSGLANGRTYPVAILIDQGSASASEILAGAMRDYQRAVLVGERSYGKGSVQVVKPLDDGAQLKLTIARYYLPNGESIQRKEAEDGEVLSGGITPDITVENGPRAVQGDMATDTQLRAAIKSLQSKLR
ncbi:MAG: S41 family peptidase [Fimbriimonadales bacterium]